MSTKLRALAQAVLLVLLTVTVAGCGPNLLERVSNFWSLSCCGAVVVILDILALIELAGSAKSTGDKVLWALVIIFFPVLGCILYYFFGRS